MYSYLHKNFDGAQLSVAPLRHFHISHNVPYLPFPSQILHNLCFSFLLGNTAVPRGIEDNACAKFGCVGAGGSNKVHYGKCESGVYSLFLRKVVGKNARDNPERYCGWF